MTGKRLLVIDDEADFAKFVARVASAMKFEVKVTTNAQDFMAAFNRFDPDVIILDIVMPDMDGLELIQWLAQEKCRARIVILSGFNPEFARMGELMATARGILSVTSMTKPVSIADLRNAIEPGGAD